MIVIDEALLREFTEKTRCELCGRSCRSGLDPHHVFGRGFGGRHRLDVRINLMSLCRACHDLFHAGKVPREKLIQIVADREKMTAESLRDEIYRLHRSRPDCRHGNARSIMSNFTPSHPYAEIFPLHDEGKPFWDFADDIQTHGLREKIILYQGKVLDGRRRERGCKRAGVEPKYSEFKGTDEEALAYVMSRNLHRRHLGEGERALAAARYATAKVGRQSTENNVGNQSSQNATINPTNKVAAEVFETSEAKVDRAKVVVEHGTPALQEAVADDTISVSDAAKVAKEPAKVQNEAVKKVRKGKAKTVAAAVKEEQEEETPWVDGWGIPITKDAAEAFKSQEQFDDLIKLLHKARALYKELADMPGGAFLTRPGVSQNTRTGWKNNGLETAILALKDCRPTYTVCPYAYAKDHDHGKECTLCHGLNWSRELGKDEAPAKLIEAAKKAHGVQ